MDTPPEARWPQALLLQDWVEVPSPQEVVLRRLVARVGSLSGAADSADREGDELMTRLGPTWARGLIARRVVVQLGAAHPRGESAVYPIEWRAAESSSLFPVLSGDLEFAAVSEGTCRVVLSASYVPPLGELGRTLDRALLHRVAESTVRSFLRKLAAVLEADDATSPAACH